MFLAGAAGAGTFLAGAAGAGNAHAATPGAFRGINQPEYERGSQDTEEE